MNKKLKVYGKRCYVVGTNIDKETKKFVDEMDKMLEEKYKDCITTIDGLDFHMTCEFCPEQYDIYKDGKQVAYFRLRYGSLKVEEIVNGDKWEFGTTICDYDLPKSNGWEGEFRSKEERTRYLKWCAKWVNKFLETGKTKYDYEREKEERYYKKHPEKKPKPTIIDNIFSEILFANLFEQISQENN